MPNSDTKNVLYEQVARIGKALASPKRLEMIELLAQGEKTVEALADELGITLKLASAHLRSLRDARVVVARREGKYMHYRLAGPDIAALGVRLREVAEEHLVELRVALGQMMAAPESLQRFDRAELMARARSGELVVIDVRPEDEYRNAHLPFARSMPLAELERRIDELPREREIVAYCRGPFCLLSDEAVRLLTAHGFRVHKISDGVAEWQAAGLPVEGAIG